MIVGYSREQHENRWLIFRFETRCDEWIDRDAPDQRQRRSFLAWLELMKQDPLAVLSTPALDAVDHEVKAEWGQVMTSVVPDTQRDSDYVLCTFAVNVKTRTVTCVSIDNMSLPRVQGDDS